MRFLIAFLFLLSFLAFSSIFNQSFYIPKLLSIYVFGLFSLFLLFSRGYIRSIPESPLIFLSVYIAISIVSALFSLTPRSGLMHVSGLFSCALVFLLIIHIKDKEKLLLLKTVVGIALFESLIGFVQIIGPLKYLLPELLTNTTKVFGTIGNQEFLATLLAVGLLVALYLLENTNNKREKVILAISAVIIGAGIFLTKSKGTLLFLTFYLVWRQTRNLKLIGILTVSAGVAVFLLYPDSVKGRLLLWLAGLSIFSSHAIVGVGLRQFENGYLDAVHGLFTNFPTIRDIFGGHTATVQDAHNIFIGHAAELGIIGIVLVVIFIYSALKVIKHNPNPLGIALLLLIYKSLYTVVLNSITGALLIALLMGCMWRRDGVLIVFPYLQKLQYGLIVLAPIIFYCIYISWSDVIYQEGQRHLFRGEYKLAERRFLRVLDIDPNHFNATLSLAYGNFIRGDRELMEKYLVRAMQYKRNMNSYKKSAHMYFYSGFKQKALPIYLYLHQCFPEHLTSMTKLAIIYMGERNYQAAYDMAKKAIKMSPRVKSLSDARNKYVADRILKDSQKYLRSSKETK